MNNKMNNERMEYYMGFPKGSYAEVLDGMARTEVYSFETSSIPLTAFWNPENLGWIQSILEAHIPGITLEDDLKFWEFPTEPVLRGVVCSDHPSMTDLMIWHPNIWQIAIEAKYTEYVRALVQTIGEWLNEKRKKHRHVLPYRNILRAWVEMIRKAKCTDISLTDFYRNCMGVGYQFLHRAASACFKTNGPEGSTPVLVYQLFYKKDDAEHVARMESFKADLRKWAKLLGLKNMKFLIVSVPVTNAEEVGKKYGDLKGNAARSLFAKMKTEDVYRFDFDGVSVETVIDTEAR